MKQKHLKIGVIGLGGRIDGVIKWCMRYKVENFSVVAITDINEERTRQRLKESPEVYAADARYYTDADEMLQKEDLDGVFVGTRANTHVEMAEKVMKKGLPLFLEKPVAIDWDNLNRLNELRKKYNPKCIVSFPLSYSPMAKRAREIIQSGALGKIEQVQAWNDVPYGRTYTHSPYKFKETTGELWLEKATHDLALINYLVGDTPKTLCAMQTHGLFGGDMPAGIKCQDCDKRTECPESDYTIGKVYGDRVPSLCPFDTKDPHHDCATVIAKYPSGLHAMYSQNFFVRFQAGRRGGRIYGYKATLEYDINNAELKLYHHDFDTVETIKFHGIKDPHCGGDEILMRTFGDLMRGKEIPSSLLEGIESAAFGLTAFESCLKDEFLPVPNME